MWTCKRCGRIFRSKNQPHSCKKIPLDKHFLNKLHTKELFEHLVKIIEKEVGKIKIISIPCCVHLFGTYDFLAALPKKDKLEIRFALDRKIKSKRLKAAVPLSKSTFKNCFDIKTKNEIGDEFVGWIKESYHLKD